MTTADACFVSSDQLANLGFTKSLDAAVNDGTYQHALLGLRNRTEKGRYLGMNVQRHHGGCVVCKGPWEGMIPDHSLQRWGRFFTNFSRSFLKNEQKSGRAW